MPKPTLKSTVDDFITAVVENDELPSGVAKAKLAKAFRATVGEMVRLQPGRAQKGAKTAAMNAVLPKIRKALK